MLQSPLAPQPLIKLYERATLAIVKIGENFETVEIF